MNGYVSCNSVAPRLNALRSACRELADSITAFVIESGQPDENSTPDAATILGQIHAATHLGTTKDLIAAGAAARSWILDHASEDERLEWAAITPNPTLQAYEDAVAAFEPA